MGLVSMPVSRAAAAGLVPSCAEGGVLGILPGLVGVIQATEVIKLIWSGRSIGWAVVACRRTWHEVSVS